MVTVYDMASGVIHRALTDAPEADNANNDVSLDQSQETTQFNCTLHVEAQLALREYERPEQDNTDKIPSVLASINTDKFIIDMEK